MLLAIDQVSVPGADPAAFVLAAPVVLTITGLIIPLITGLLTKWTCPAWVKGLLTLALNVAAAAIVTATQADGTAVFSNALLMSTVYGFVVSVVAYSGLWKPANLTSSTPAGKLAPSAGLGPTVPRGE